MREFPERSNVDALFRDLDGFASLVGGERGFKVLRYPETKECGMENRLRIT